MITFMVEIMLRHGKGSYPAAASLRFAPYRGSVACDSIVGEGIGLD